MSIHRKIKNSKRRRALHVRNRLRQDSTLPRISVFRSLKHIYAQVVDMKLGKTVASCSSLEVATTGSKKSKPE